MTQELPHEFDTEQNGAIPMAYENLRTVKQIAQTNPAFSEASLRWMIFNASKNGFDRVIVKLGRRVLIDIEAFDRWIEYSKPKPIDRSVAR